MARPRRFLQCDVFSATPGRGNALAVVLDAEDLSEETLRAFAAWTNLAETTFVRVRIGGHVHVLIDGTLTL